MSSEPAQAESGPGPGEILERLRGEPASTAILTDVDGTLAPIVGRPEDAEVPPRARAALARLSGRFGLVGCVSGRRAQEARRLVGVEGLAYAGNHGLELLGPGDAAPRLDASLEGRESGPAEFVAQLDAAALADAGMRLEDKGPIQALHWRGAGDEREAEARARQLAAAAVRAGLEPHWGRKVLELRPPGGSGKDSAVAALLAGRDIAVAAYAGDDRTDLDAFRRLRELRERGSLQAAFCIGIASPEGPPELAGESDLLLDGPGAWVDLLEALAGAQSQADAESIA